MHNHYLTAGSLIGLIGGLLVSCSVAGQRPSQPTLQQDQRGEFLLIRVATSDGPMLGGAEILLVSSTGIEPLGVTDSVGSAKIPRAQLSAPDAYVLLVCSEYHFCGAFRLDAPGLLDLNDYFIALAPFAI